ncbi:MAG: transglutaminase-like domain-containing protein, partial [Candidatus Magnetoovum sp. WYHC-5]|nr:transglutaminase-like domain-containing protein [Candidatus Magnetoovum sp. WYHC-5]
DTNVGKKKLSVKTKRKAPTQEDLAETLEVKFTDEIKEQAKYLENHPVKIYEWVKNNVNYEPYYGSLKGAQQTLRETAGNDYDQASLLIALLRASNIPARYVSGTIEMPIERLQSWLGGVNDQMAAVQIMATNGIPGNTIRSGGKIKSVRFEHVWVEAYVPMFPSMGAANYGVKAWTVIDPSFKEAIVNKNMKAINIESFDEMSYLTSDNATMPPLLFYMKEIIGDDTDKIVEFSNNLYYKGIDVKFFNSFLGTLQYKIINKQSYGSIPDAKRHKVKLGVFSKVEYNNEMVSVEKNIVEMAGKKITLSFVPATSEDQDIISLYGGLLYTPLYLLTVKPEIAADNTILMTGNSMNLGSELFLRTKIISPNLNTEVMDTDITHGIDFIIGITALDYTGKQIIDQIDVQNNYEGYLYDSINQMDDRAGDMLQNIAIEYLDQLNKTTSFIDGVMHIHNTKMPSVIIVSADAYYDEIFGVSSSLEQITSLTIDAINLVFSPIAIDGDQNRRKEYIKQRGLNSSYLEHRVLENFIKLEVVSAVKALITASQYGIPIYNIDSSNVNSIMPLLTVSERVKTNINNAINAGKEVI